MRCLEFYADLYVECEIVLPRPDQLPHHKRDPRISWSEYWDVKHQEDLELHRQAAKHADVLRLVVERLDNLMERDMRCSLDF